MFRECVLEFSGSGCCARGVLNIISTLIFSWIYSVRGGNIGVSSAFNLHTTLTFIAFNIHLCNTIIHSFFLHHLPWPVFLLSSSLLCSAREAFSGCRAENRTRICLTASRRTTLIGNHTEHLEQHQSAPCTVSFHDLPERENSAGKCPLSCCPLVFCIKNQFKETVPWDVRLWDLDQCPPGPWVYH